MKRVVVAILLCICLLSATVYAVVPLAPIAAAAIGASLLTVLGTSNTKVALNPQGSFGYDGPDLTVPVAVYNQYMQASASIALGYLSNIPWNFKEAWNQGLIQAVPNWDSIIKEVFPSTIPNPQIGDILQQPFSCGGSSVLITRTETGGGYCDPHTNSNCPPATRCDLDGIVFYTETSRPYFLYYTYVKVFTKLTDNPVNYPPVVGPPGTLTDQQANALANKIAAAANSSPQNKEAAENMVKQNPGLLGQPASITSAQVQAYAQQAAQEAVAANIQAIQSALAADPTNVNIQLQLAAAQAEAAKLAADQIAKQADPEPSFPVPSSWYTGKCNPDNVASCIKYQQVLDATDALKATAPYQIPNFLLDCLDFIKGDGCTYPPTLTIDLFTRFTSSPLNIDLSPLESVITVMRFFFSLLCFVSTYKAVMYLFK